MKREDPLPADLANLLSSEDEKSLSPAIKRKILVRLFQKGSLDKSLMDLTEDGMFIDPILKLQDAMTFNREKHSAKEEQVTEAANGKSLVNKEGNSSKAEKQLGEELLTFWTHGVLPLSDFSPSSEKILDKPLDENYVRKRLLSHPDVKPLWEEMTKDEQAEFLKKVKFYSSLTSNYIRQKSDKGQEKKIRGVSYIYYKNDISVGYRSLDGNISYNRILLHQQEPSWYGRFLAAIGLSTKQGLSIPKYKQLFLTEDGKWKQKYAYGLEALYRLERQNQNSDNSPLQKLGAKLQQYVHKKQAKSETIPLDVPYEAKETQLIADLLGAFPDLGLELILNKPNSMSQFLNFAGLSLGANVESVLIAPLKDMAKSLVELFRLTITNIFGSLGYMTPLAAGSLAPVMQARQAAWTLGVLAVSVALLAYSIFGLGLTGFAVQEIPSISLLFVPMVTMVLGGSLLRTLQPLLLNYHRNPEQRTAANLRVSSYQQASRTLLAVLTALLPLFHGIEVTPFIAIPIVSLVFLSTMLLFFNTPLYDELRSKGKRTDKQEKASAQAQEARAEASKKEEDKREKISSQIKEAWAKEYKEEILTKNDEAKRAIHRVRMVYIAYAASIMNLAQLTSVYGEPAGQLMVAATFAAAWIMRSVSKKLVAKGRFTDDQLSGIAILGMAVTAGMLLFIPYSPTIGSMLMVLGVGMLHGASTAIPGQLDNTRLQNIVTATITHQKEQVLSKRSLTANAEEKQALDNKIKLFKDKEKFWGGLASRSYSFANSFGLVGIAAATLLAMTVSDLQLPFMSDFVRSWFDASLPAEDASFHLYVRAVFLFAAIVSTIASFKNRDMIINFLSALKKADNNQKADEVKPSSLYVMPSNYSVQGGVTAKKIAEQGRQLSKGFISTEKAVSILKKFYELNNMSWAIKEVSAKEVDKGRAKDVINLFSSLKEQINKYEEIISKKNNPQLSPRVWQYFEAFKTAALKKDGTMKEEYVVLPELPLPNNMDALLWAEALIKEMQSRARTMLTMNYGFNHNTYARFLGAYIMAKKKLEEYQEANMDNNVCTEESTIHYWQDEMDKIMKEIYLNEKKLNGHDFIPTINRLRVHGILQYWGKTHPVPKTESDVDRLGF